MDTYMSELKLESRMKKVSEPYMVYALRRVSKAKNENVGLKELAFKRLCTDNDIDSTLSILKEIIGCKEGVWRFYRSVNRRSLKKAFTELQVELIRNPASLYVDSIWKSVLSKDVCKAERKFLVDIDTSDFSYIGRVERYVLGKTNILEISKTPNGYHIVVEKFDTRELLEKFDKVEIKKDALFYLYSRNIPGYGVYNEL